MKLEAGSLKKINKIDLSRLIQIYPDLSRKKREKGLK